MPHHPERADGFAPGFNAVHPSNSCSKGNIMHYQVRRIVMGLLPLALVLIVSLQPPAAFAQGTAFTYQGLLSSNNAVLTGNFDFQFNAYPNSAGTGGPLNSSPVTVAGVGVTNGLFNVTIDFGAGIFTGNATWLAISVRSSGAGIYTPMSPLVELNPTPYAIYAESANTVSLLTDPGTENFFAGPSAGNSSNPGTYNVAVGPYAFQWPTSGSDNVAIGYLTLANNSSGSANTATGFEALEYNSLGFGNTADGFQALNANTTQSQSTAVGYQALFMSTGGQNAALGYRAMLNDTSGSQNVALGGGALEANTSGSQNTATGFQAMNVNQTGGFNTADGYQALFYITSGSNNTATGYQAMFGNSFGGNSLGSTADGFRTLWLNGGINDTAVGFCALSNNLTGSNNTAVGYNALCNNGSGSYNIAIGQEAMKMNTSGINEVAIGYQAMENGDGLRYSTAVGYQALQSATGGPNNGDNNTAVGYEALSTITAGQGNIAIGEYAGTGIGYSANNNIDIGNPGMPTDNNAIRLGNEYIQTATYLAGTVYANGVVLTSDRNAKENIQPVDSREILDKVAAMPVSRWNYKRTDHTAHIGPMAQDFYAAFATGPDDKHIGVIDEGGVALAAIKGLNEKLEQQNQEQNAEIRELKQNLADVKALLQSLNNNK
jgi:hypothetical protein